VVVVHVEIVLVNGHIIFGVAKKFVLYFSNELDLSLMIK
jgi:hypothetical protein